MASQKTLFSTGVVPRTTRAVPCGEMLVDRADHHEDDPGTRRSCSKRNDDGAHPSVAFWREDDSVGVAQLDLSVSFWGIRSFVAATSVGVCGLFLRRLCVVRARAAARSWSSRAALNWRA